MRRRHLPSREEGLMTTDQLATGLPWVERIAASFPVRDFARFHRYELPSLLSDHVHLAVGDLHGVPPLAFRIEDGTTLTWIASDDGVHLVDGDRDAATVVELDRSAFSAFVNEL